MLIAPEALWTAGRLRRGMALEARDGIVTGVRALGADTPDARPALVMPMAVDLQVNGGGGVMVNSDPTPDGLRVIAAAHRGLGTGAILPTVITDTAEVMHEAVSAAIEVAGEPGQLGLHIEGPHLAPSRRGTHKPEYIRPLDETTVAEVERLRAAGVAVMITLAPERAQPDLLARLVASGAVVSAGHSAADAAEAQAGFDAGVSCVTHLYNAMEPMTSRAPGLLGRALVSPVHVGIIADGIHVAWDMIRVALRARPAPGLTFAVSDAMATVGGPDSFILYGQEIRVRDGALVNAEGSLAGAHIDMLTSLANLVREVGVDLSEAVAMCTDTPRAVLGLAPEAVTAGTRLDDILILNDRFERERPE
ncbi:N-acetylglucosamine-6-phosphate deacetylase [Maritimibacter fusiformis]|uniref:N-acetylglucosamine-6-phosphate deacetylase n=1 Tax=Maritimibacter fusiformis TaxID=2603819 RepID=A0A5D0RNF6_9RHOB|nr:N-acetylglucosamine-6-phosphate deacetylase [Maritimibacter fusiformis]TYB82385.1 N-acetylglucosamine-6-phosphate deacetylase [Maritimibacter fusiformis]